MINHGGVRPGSGRPKGSKNSTKYNPAGTQRVRFPAVNDIPRYEQVHEITIARPRVFTDPETMRIKANEYFEACSNASVMPTRYSFLDYLGMGRMTFTRYFQLPEFAEILDQAIAKIIGMTEFGLMNDPSNTVGYATMLKILDGGNGKSNNLILDTNAETKPMTPEDRLEHLR